jgi:hypothetical protein
VSRLNTTSSPSIESGSAATGRHRIRWVLLCRDPLHQALPNLSCSASSRFCSAERHRVRRVLLRRDHAPPRIQPLVAAAAGPLHWIEFLVAVDAGFSSLDRVLGFASIRQTTRSRFELVVRLRSTFLGQLGSVAQFQLDGLLRSVGLICSLEKKNCCFCTFNIAMGSSSTSSGPVPVLRCPVLFNDTNYYD